MEKLPVELIENICNALDHDQVALKEVRLFNRKFADTAAHFLFKTLAVFQHLSSWRKVRLIAQCPRLAHLVQKLEIVTLAIGGETLKFDEWKQESQDYRVQGRLRLGNRGAAVAELVEPLDYKLGVVLRLQQRYQTWLWWDKGQEAIEQTAVYLEGHGLPTSLRLPALSEIETVWPPDLWIPGPDAVGRRRGSHLGLSRRFEPLNQVCNAHLSFAMLCLHESDLKITTLELHQYREILSNRKYPVPTLVYLKHLKLRFRHYFTVKWQEAVLIADNLYRSNRVLAPYLANAENLETLILSQELSCGTDIGECIWYNLMPILSTALWPKLRSIWVGEIFAMDGRLAKLLMRHGNSLRSIHLDRPARQDYYWQWLAYNIRTQYANTNCVITSSDDTVFRSKSDGIKESDRSNYDDWHESEQYLGSWSAQW